MSDIYDEIGEELDPTNYDTSDTSDPLPPGEYPVIIEKAEIRNTKAGTGKYVWVQLRVIEGQHENRVAFHNMNIKNPNPTAEQIGRKDLAILAAAIGITLKDTSQLIDKAVVAKLKVKDNDNAVVTYKPYGVAPKQPAADSAPSHAAPVGATTEPKKMPWQR